MKLNIGCGNDYRKGYKNIDISRKVKADEYYDISKVICEKSSTIDEIIANGVLEQFEKNKTFRFILNECHRVLKKDGILKGQVPSTNMSVLCLDPWDRRWFLVETFEYFNINEIAWQNFGKQYWFLPWKDVVAEVDEYGIINFQMRPAVEKYAQNKRNLHN